MVTLNPGRRAVLSLVAASLVVSAGMVGLSGVGPPVSDDAPSDFEFVDVSDEAGFDYAANGTGAGNGNEGVYVLDYNNDGWPDILAIGGEQPVLFENTGGEFERSGVLPAVDRKIQSVLVFDRDNDGWEDVLLLPRRGQGLYLENDNGTLSRKSVGLDVSVTVPVAASAGDVDRDGTLDVFIAQYGEWGQTTPRGWNSRNFDGDDNGNENILLLNRGGTFERADEAGIRGTRWSLATSIVDLNGDGWPDIHVANDFNNDVIYVNQGDGTFALREMGNATDRNGMSSEVVDVNRDGRPDLFVTNIYLPISKENVSEDKYELIKRFQEFVLGKRAKGNTLLVNQGNGSFADAATTYGVRKGGWGWAAVATDFDNDGDQDLFTSTQAFITLDEANPKYPYSMIWRRTDDGFVNLDASEIGFRKTDGRGAATLDFDRDGRMDLVVANHNGEYVLYENRIDGGNSIEIELSSAGGVRLGATVAVTVDGRTQRVVVNARADYQSQDSRIAHFGLGSSETVDEIRIVWPDGTEQVLTDVEANQLLVVGRDGVRRRMQYHPTNES